MKTAIHLREGLAEIYGGCAVVICASGVVDVLTPTHAVVVKHISEWKHAAGAALIYSIDTHRKPAVYLFDVVGEHAVGIGAAAIARIEPYLERLGVILMNDDHISRPFSSAPDESIASIVTQVVVTSTAGIRALAVNKRIHRITRSLWPSILRAKLYFKPHAQACIEGFCTYIRAPIDRTDTSYSASILPSNEMAQHYNYMSMYALPPFAVSIRNLCVHISAGKYVVQFKYEPASGTTSHGGYHLHGTER